MLTQLQLTDVFLHSCDNITSGYFCARSCQKQRGGESKRGNLCDNFQGTNCQCTACLQPLLGWVSVPRLIYPNNILGTRKYCKWCFDSLKWKVILPWFHFSELVLLQQSLAGLQRRHALNPVSCSWHPLLSQHNDHHYVSQRLGLGKGQCFEMGCHEIENCSISILTISVI